VETDKTQITPFTSATLLPGNPSSRVFC
jgi:hypothetical protein